MAESNSNNEFLHKIQNYLYRFENLIGVLALLAMAFLPVLELVLRALFRSGISGSSEFVQHLTLWVGFGGAMMTAREDRHLSLSEGIKIVPARYKGSAKIITSAISTAVAAALAWASYQFVQFEVESVVKVGTFLPVWIAETILPISFSVIAMRFIAKADGVKGKLLTGLGIPIAIVVGFLLQPYAAHLLWPSIIILIGAALAGSPIFVVLGGSALLLFYANEISTAAIMVEAYRIVVSPSIPAIPLFTMAGFILSEGKTSQRLVTLFHELFSWIPGGMVVATTLVCAFFSTFTGASGVTILALGGLLMPVLVRNGYSEKFATGLLTSTGSIGLLFPPSLAVILYAVIAHIPIPDLFVAGVVPGILMLAVITIFGVWQMRGGAIQRGHFDAKKTWEAVKNAKWEIFLPVVVLTALFGGFTTLIESAAITAVYATLVALFIHRDITISKDLPRILIKCLVMLGGIFVIFGVAMGLTNYLVDAMIPMKAAKWVAANVESKFTFLLALNIFLLVVGSLMDIFSAIVVVVPLIIPIAKIYNIDPLHLGMIFLVNLELGYLTPPVGMNLFLASFRLERPLFEVYKSALPFLAVLGIIVLLVTYAPFIIIGVD